MADEVLGARLKRLRDRAGKTQEQVSAEIGVSSKAYSSWETGRHDVRGRYVPPLCRSLGCTPNDIFGCDVADGRSPVAPASPLLDEKVMEFIELYDRTPANVRGAIHVIMESAIKTRRPRRPRL
ncbi:MULTISPECIES: helix-turn-helix transcriptional regulator [Olsenella]|uniref:helix-turn-helix transcriptional regulator n=1 Tax=Olsenella TaxID=133925 RepID=UPI00071C2A40|nr:MULTISPECIES: helix-turn-helix transcriptional regulator [Olsenella]OFK23568.1 hypothetical protein HMPREF2826_04700 [Olsenella sp. HMSC062G07]